MAKGGAYLAPYCKLDQKLPAEVKDALPSDKTGDPDGNFRVDVNEAPSRSPTDTRPGGAAPDPPFPPAQGWTAP